MSFTFFKTDGSLLKPKDVQKLFDENESGEISFSVVTEKDTIKPRVFLRPSSDMGEIRFPSMNSVQTDYADMLHWGSNEETNYGLYVYNGSTWKRFSHSAGSNYKTGINLIQAEGLTEGDSFMLKLKFIKDPEKATRRFYLGVMIDDS